MVSKYINRTLFLYRDGARLHRMKFYIYECTERDDLKSMIRERCGIVVETKQEHVVCFATQCIDEEDGEVFSTDYIKQCCEKNMLLDLKKFRLGKKPTCSNVDPLEVLKGLASWPQNIRCFTNLNQNNSSNERKKTLDSELSTQKRKRSIRINCGMEQERGLCYWRQPYSIEEDVKIIRYLLKNNNYKKAGTNTLWKMMELKEVLKDRSWQSMKNRLRIIRLHPERYDLNDEDIKKLGGKTAADISPKVSVDKGRCCFCCPKMDPNDCGTVNGSANVTCHCSQHIKRRAETSVERGTLVEGESIVKKVPVNVQSHTNRAEQFSYSSSTSSDGGTDIERDPKHCFSDRSSPFHKKHIQDTVKNGARQNQKRKLYIRPSSGINISIRSGDISLVKNNSVPKEFSVPLRWPLRFTPVNSAVFSEQGASSGTVTPEVLNHNTQDKNASVDDNDRSVCGSCQSREKENSSATYSSKSPLSDEEFEAAVDNLITVNHKCNSSKTEDILPDKSRKPLDVKNHSTPKKTLQILNKTGSRNFVNNSESISECSKVKLVENRMNIDEEIVSPSFSGNSSGSGFGLRFREERSANCVNECSKGDMSLEYCKLKTSKTHKLQPKSPFGITNMLYSNRLQDEVSPITQHSNAQDIRRVPEENTSSTYPKEHSNSKQQSTSRNLPEEDSVEDGDKHCQHISNYKDFYVEQWLNTIMPYYENGNLSKVPSSSEKLNIKEMVISSKSDRHFHKNVSCDNLDEEMSGAAEDINKSSSVQRDMSEMDGQIIIESCYEVRDYNSAVNDEIISSSSCEISVQDESVCGKVAFERLDKEPSQISSIEGSRNIIHIVENVPETPDRNVISEKISENPHQSTAADSEGDQACLLQSCAERISSVNNESSTTQPVLQLSHIISLRCEHNQVQCYEETCDSSDNPLESQPSQVSNYIPVPIKHETSISICDTNDSLRESRPTQVSNHMSISIKQETSISVEDEEFRYEGYSPPVDFLTHMSDDDE